MDITPYLKLMVDKNASDLFFYVGAPVNIKIGGVVRPIGNKVLGPGQVREIAYSVMKDDQIKEFEHEWELNFAIPLQGVGRFRSNVFKQRGEVSMVIRFIRGDIPQVEELGLPTLLRQLVMEKRGLVMLVGATGSGKSTTLAAMVDHRNSSSPGHIITIEDPIEFTHQHKKSVVGQREIGIDTHGYENALRSAMREAPDVILVGEVRAREVMKYVLTFAETGHLVLSTLHANNANGALDRIVNFFPEDVRPQLLLDLSLNLRAIVSQRLIRSLNGGLVPAVEVLLNTPYISDLIQKGKIDYIKDAMEQSTESGTQTFDQSLFKLYREGKISKDEAIKNADSKNNVGLKIRLAEGSEAGSGPQSSNPTDLAIHEDEEEVTGGGRLAFDQVATARRMADIAPFHVMALLARAKTLEAAGCSIIHLEIGEPDFATAAPIIAAGQRALAEGRTRYTAAAGLPELRQAISDHYRDCYGVEVPARRILITPGASGALQLATAVLINPGDRVLLADPGYPCNRHFVRLVEGEAVGIPVGPDTGYQLTVELVERYWDERATTVLLASPANPTGTVIAPDELAAIVAMVETQGGRVIMDEIYHGLVYGASVQTALAVSERVFVVNSFSKYYGMTGWRLGWLVAPDDCVGDAEKLAQNLYLAASTPAQYAALAAFTPEAQAIFEERRQELQARRDFLLPALRDLGFHIPVTPDGAFYLYADCGRFTDDSYGFTLRLLEETGVAITPGLDFGHHRPQRHVRFAYTNAIPKLAEGVKRLRGALRSKDKT